MYDLLQRTEKGHIDLAGTQAALEARFPKFGIVEGGNHVIGITAQVARLVLGRASGTKEMAQHLWLFELAGRLKGALSESQRLDPDIGGQLAPLSLLLVDIIEAMDGLPKAKKRLQWDDADAVMLEFEEIWYKRKFPKGSPFLDDAVAFAFKNPLRLTGNIHYVRLLNVAYYLQTKQPDLPILLPISTGLAGKLQTTPVTLGTAVSKAIREGLLEIVDGHYDIKAGKARSFKLNLDHPILQERKTKLG